MKPFDSVRFGIRAANVGKLSMGLIEYGSMFVGVVGCRESVYQFR